MIYLTAGPQHILVLEPSNIDLLKQGKPVASPDKEVFVAYCPDVDWLSGQIMKLIQKQGREFEVGQLDALLHEGLTRKEIYRTDAPKKVF